MPLSFSKLSFHSVTKLAWQYDEGVYQNMAANMASCGDWVIILQDAARATGRSTATIGLG